MKFFKRIAIGVMMVLFTASLTGCVNKTNASVYNEISKISKEVLGKISEENGAAISIAVMDEGEIVYSDEFGMADRENNLKVDKNTLFNIASISKAFAAVATLLLVDEGKINLDEKVTTYLPEFTMADERYKNITVRMLLNHSSGIGGIYDTDAGYAFNPDEDRFQIETLKNSHLSFNPGYANMYCNVGYGFLQTIIEKVSEKTFIDFINEKIFIPLGMNNTWLGVGERNSNNIAKFYDEGTKKPYPNEVVSDLASGGLSSTPTDVCLFGKSFFEKGKNLLSQTSLEEMKKVQSTPFSNNFDGAINFGLGLDSVTTVKNSNGTTATILTKDGSVPHYSSNLIVVPELGISIAVIVTNNKDGWKNIDYDILNMLLKSKEYGALPAINLSPEEQRVPDSLYKYKGNYIAGSDIHNFSFDKINNTLISTSLKDSEDKATFKYYSGYFKKQKEKSEDEEVVWYFKEVDGIKYFVILMLKMNWNAPCFQQIQEHKNIQLSEKIEDKVWLRRNSKPYHPSQTLDSHIVRPHVYKQVPGYIRFRDVNKIESPNFAGFSSILRDGSEFSLLENGNQSFINCNGSIYYPDDVCKKLKAKKNTVNIGDQAYSEWRIVDKNCSLDFEVPSNGRVAIFDSNGELLYDNIIHTGSFSTTEKCYIECIGNVDDEFTIKMS